MSLWTPVNPLTPALAFEGTQPFQINITHISDKLTFVDYESVDTNYTAYDLSTYITSSLGKTLNLIRYSISCIPSKYLVPMDVLIHGNFHTHAQLPLTLKPLFQEARTYINTLSVLPPTYPKVATMWVLSFPAKRVFLKNKPSAGREKSPLLSQALCFKSVILIELPF